MKEDYVSLKGVVKEYSVGDRKIRAVDDLSFSVNEGEFVVILGPSGAGKTTVLNLLGGMDTITSGEITVDGKNLKGLKPKELTLYRRYDVGFVFQFYNLMPNLTALENVELAVEICDDYIEPKEALKKVGLDERIRNFPSQLSGGEQQRVSIARAIAKKPKILLCDEPTGALDYKTGKMILQILTDICRVEKKTVIVVTHNAAIKEIADRVVHIKNGTVISTEVNGNPKSVEEIEW